MKKNILVAGGTGLIGRNLTSRLLGGQYRLQILTRSKNHSNAEDIEYIQWDPESQFVEKAPADIFGVVNLAGEGIAQSRWTENRKNRIVNSRVKSTEFLAAILSGHNINPEVYIGASAIGIYGDGGDTWLYESDPSGISGFLSSTCQSWEEAHKSVENMCKRFIINRIGIVLAQNGGALEKMAIPLRFGLNPIFGKGRQYYSWVHIHDLTEWFHFCLADEDCRGIYNIVAPNPMRAGEFARLMAIGMGKKARCFNVPEWVLRGLMGELADTVLWSQRVSAEKLLSTGFVFKYPELEEAFHH